MYVLLHGTLPSVSAVQILQCGKLCTHRAGQNHLAICIFSHSSFCIPLPPNPLYLCFLSQGEGEVPLSNGRTYIFACRKAQIQYLASLVKRLLGWQMLGKVSEGVLGELLPVIGDITECESLRQLPRHTVYEFLRMRT